MPIVFVNEPQPQQQLQHHHNISDTNAKRSMEAIKICVVCGDRANGYNFNVIACESCKAFFRRNALRKKDFKCPFNGNCKIDAITRKFCQKCRLQKCFNSGMKKDLILTDEEKRIIKFKIAENKQKRVKLNESPNNSVDSTTLSAPQSLPTSLCNNTGSIAGVGPTLVGVSNHTANQYLSQIIMNSNNANISNNVNIHNNNSVNHNILHNCSHIMSYNNMDYNNKAKRKSEFLVNGTPSQARNWNFVSDESNGSNSNHSRPSVIKFSPIEAKKTNMNLEELEFFNKFFCLNKLEEIFRSEIESDSANETGDKDCHKIAVKSENTDTSENSNPASPGCRPDGATAAISVPKHVLNDLELNRMNELSHAFKELADQELIIQEQARQQQQHMDAVKMTDNAVRRLIQMIKKINGYKNLCQHDQIALMKAGCTEIIILRSVQTYNFEREFWSILKDTKNPEFERLDLLKQSLRPSIFEAHKKFMTQIGHEWDTDLDILNLLSTIVLFDPNRPNIIHKDMIAFEHQINKYLLQRYLEIKYGTKSEARDKYMRLMKTLDELHVLNEENVRYHLEVDPREIGPLLIELFDLKP